MLYVCMYVCTVDEEADGEVDFPGGYGTKAHVTPRSAEELQVWAALLTGSRKHGTLPQTPNS